MPANLPPQYHEVERKFREAKEASEKLDYLREMYAILPKHKGTDKLQADLKRRISKLQDALQKSHKIGRRPYAFSIEREGAAQVVLLGPTNSGKSSILRALTHAEPEVAAYPFTTRTPMPGMMPFEDIQIQLVDMPPIVDGGVEHWFFQIVRGCNAALIVIDGTSQAMLKDIELVGKEMARAGIYLAGTMPGTTPRTTPKDQSDANETQIVKKALIVANKMDIGSHAETLALLEACLDGGLKAVPFSAVTKEGTDPLKSDIFRMLSLVRVYTKVPGKKPDLGRPFVLPLGSTVLDVASLVHKDFASNLKSARIWGAGVFAGQFVDRDHVVNDKDLVELHL